ncbi:MAG: cytochrome oxidase small assembly protein [Burkholderiales bacterium]
MEGIGQSARNRRTAILLWAIVVCFFFGIMIKFWMQTA